METQNTNHDNIESKANARIINVWGLAGELGVLIATPVVMFVLIGIWIDKKLGTLPLFIIIGIVLAMVTSIIVVAKRVKGLI